MLYRQTPVSTVKDELGKFLGSYVTYHGKTQETYRLIFNKIFAMLGNIESFHVRPEYKVRVWTEYGLL